MMVVRARTSKRRKAMLKAATLAALWMAVPEGAAEAGQIFNYTGAVQNWTVPTTGQYQVVASGAQGGSDGFGAAGGKGAQIGGFLTLAAGDVLAIYVGGQGGNGAPNRVGGGGGGSFVYNTTSTTLLIAAGGGGGAYGPGGDGQITQGANPGQGGGTFNGMGGGGAGWLSGGADSNSGAKGGKAFPSLAGGASAGDGAGAGGFGGGGGGAGGGNGGAGGGGGGWSGGQGVSLGGYSLNTGTNQTNIAGFQTGNGQVEITAFTPPGVPEPGSMMLMASGFAAMAAGSAWSRRRRLGL